MIRSANEKSRKAALMKFFIRHSPGSSLLQTLSFLLLVYVVQAPAVFISCTPFSGADGGINADASAGIGPAGTTPQGTVPAAESAIFICGGGAVDLFVYSCEGVRSLEFHKRVTCGADTVLLFRGDGRKTAVAVADCPFRFNLDALRTYESVEMLQMNLDDEDVLKPVRSAAREFVAGEECILQPESVLCTVELAKIVNGCGRNCRLENPEIRLANANTCAEILRFNGFVPPGTNNDTLKVRLDWDIGANPQFPCKRIYCYPNDSEATIGTPATKFILRGTMGGRTREYETELPPLGRGAVVKVYAGINEPDSCEFRFF